MAASAMILGAWRADAQFLPDLQARSAAEFDAYLDAAEARGEDRISKAKRFLSAYPDSELRLRIHELVAEACREKGDADCARTSAEAGLKAAPDYIPLLTLLGAVAANTSATPDPEPARRALELLDRAKAPKSVDAAVWKRETARLRAENLASLGIVAYKRGAADEAILRFQESLRLHATDPGRYRLALLYVDAGRREEAAVLLREVSASPETALRDRARAALERIERR